MNLNRPLQGRSQKQRQRQSQKRQQRQRRPPKGGRYKGNAKFNGKGWRSEDRRYKGKFNIVGDVNCNG
jgi:hypothetical protein